MRLIDVDIDVNDYVETWDCNCITGGIQTVMAVDDLSYLPTVDAVPVVHGKWDRTTSDYECSNCQYPMDYITPYCPNCGARMDGDINAAD